MSQTPGREGDGKSRRWWWRRSGIGVSPLLAFDEMPIPHASRRAAAMRPSVSHQQGRFHMALIHLAMTVWFVAIDCPAGLSPLFISHGSHCAAVNNCKADSLVSSHKFSCWKKRFVYSCVSLQMWLFMELCVPPCGNMFGKSDNENSVRNL